MSVLNDAWAKWNRGNVHLKALEVEMPAWLTANPYRSVHEVNPEGTKYVLRASHRGGNPPDGWGLTVGDALFNFRGALDHAVFRLAIIRSGADPPPHEAALQFQIPRDSTKFHEAVKRNRLGDLATDSEIVDEIESTQPYDCIDQDGEPFGLWFLQKLNNADKHRRIQVVVARITGGGFKFIQPTDPPMTVSEGQVFSFDWHSGAIEDGTPMFTWTSNVPFFPRDMKVNQELVLTPCLRHDAGGTGEYVGCLWVLRRISAAVEQAISLIEGCA
jgi:hypothetical protein